MAKPLDHREQLAGATHLATAILADTNDIRTTLRTAARTAANSAGIINPSDERLDLIITLGVITALGPVPQAGL